MPLESNRNTRPFQVAKSANPTGTAKKTLDIMNAVESRAKNKEVTIDQEQSRNRKPSVFNLPESPRTSTTKNKKRVGEVSVSYFVSYSQVICKNVDEVRALGTMYELSDQPKPSQYVDWGEMDARHGNSFDTDRFIMGLARMCEECHCEIDEPVEPSQQRVRLKVGGLCDADDTVKLCEEVFVVGEKVNEAELLAARLAIRQRQLQGFPGKAREIGAMSRQYGNNGGSSSSKQMNYANNRHAIHGTAESYYVEGPGNGLPTWDWLNGLKAAGSGFAGFVADKATSRYPKGRKRPHKKREEAVTPGASPDTVPDVAPDIAPEPAIDVLPNILPDEVHDTSGGDYGDGDGDGNGLEKES
ncbi:hypothetical protein ABW20_dc0103278 [Dactylellina cionopaga]|nr:hypothetical protein ABW20_dc0103278 [Dactylellina cionopaga]